MPKIKNKGLKSVLLDRNGFGITVQQALARIRNLRKAKTRNPELFELNGGSLDLLLLYQFVEQHEKWNGEKSEAIILSEAQNKLLNCKIEKVSPETYPCGVLIKTLED
jgi:hypothetical protein